MIWKRRTVGLHSVAIVICHEWTSANMDVSWIKQTYNVRLSSQTSQHTERSCNVVSYLLLYRLSSCEFGASKVTHWLLFSPRLSCWVRFKKPTFSETTHIQTIAIFYNKHTQNVRTQQFHSLKRSMRLSHIYWQIKNTVVIQFWTPAKLFKKRFLFSTFPLTNHLSFLLVGLH